jgi:hypothetical protein
MAAPGNIPLGPLGYGRDSNKEEQAEDASENAIFDHGDIKPGPTGKVSAKVVGPGVILPSETPPGQDHGSFSAIDATLPLPLRYSEPGA